MWWLTGRDIVVHRVTHRVSAHRESLWLTRRYIVANRVTHWVSAHRESYGSLGGIYGS